MSRLTHAITAATLLTTIGATTAQASTLDRIERKVYRLGVAALDAVDATPAQRRAIQDIAARAAVRLAPYEVDATNIFQDAHRAWTAQTVQRTDVEAVRVDAIELLDHASADSVDFVVEAAKVLTPAQRRELARAAREHAARLID